MWHGAQWISDCVSHSPGWDGHCFLPSRFFCFSFIFDKDILFIDVTVFDIDKCSHVYWHAYYTEMSINVPQAALNVSHRFVRFKRVTHKNYWEGKEWLLYGFKSSVRLQPSYLPFRLNKHRNFVWEISKKIQNIQPKLYSLSKHIVTALPFDVLIICAV